MKLQVYLLGLLTITVFANSYAMEETKKIGNEKTEDQIKTATRIKTVWRRETLRREFATIFNKKICTRAQNRSFLAFMPEKETEELATDFDQRDRELQGAQQKNSPNQEKFILYARGVANGFVKGFAQGQAHAIKNGLATQVIDNAESNNNNTITRNNSDTLSWPQRHPYRLAMITGCTGAATVGIAWWLNNQK